MITIAQCRAARGLLDWTQQDLAKNSNLSKTAINNFEKGYTEIKIETAHVIRSAFERQGIQFLDNEGVRIKLTKDINSGEKELADFISQIKDLGVEGTRILERLSHKKSETHSLK